MNGSLILAIIALVASVDGDRIEVDRGAADGIAVGDRASIYYELDVGGESRRFDVGDGTVVDVAEESATLDVESGKPVRPGHRVEVYLPTERFDVRPASAAGAERHRIANLLAERDDLMARITELEDEVTMAEGLVGELQGRLSAIEGERDRGVARLSDLEAELVGHEESERASAERIASLEAALEQNRDEFARRLRQEAESAAAMAAESRSLQEAAAGQAEELSALRAELDKVSAAGIEREQENLSLSSRLEASIGGRETLMRKVTELESRLVDKAAELDRVLRDLDTAQSALAAVREDVDRSTAESARLQAELATARQLGIELQARLDDGSTDQRIAREQLDEALHDLGERTKELQDARGKVAGLESDLASARQRELELVDRLQATGAEAESLAASQSQERDQARAANDELVEVIAGLEEELKRRGVAAEAEAESLAAARIELKQRSEDLATARSELERARSTVADLRSAVGEGGEERAEIEATLENAHERSMILERKLSEEREAKAALRDSLQRELVAARGESAETASQLEMLRRELADARAQIGEYEAQLEAHKVAALGAAADAEALAVLEQREEAQGQRLEALLGDKTALETEVSRLEARVLALLEEKRELEERALATPQVASESTAREQQLEAELAAAKASSERLIRTSAERAERNRQLELRVAALERQVSQEASRAGSGRRDQEIGLEALTEELRKVRAEANRLRDELTKARERRERRE